MKFKKHLAFTLLVSLAVSATTFAQEASPAEGAAAGPHAQSVYEVIKAGGVPGIIVWLGILAASITMVGFVIQNFLTLRREKLAPQALVDALENDILAGNYQAAWETCNANNNYLANVLKAALSRLGRGKEAVEDGIAEHALREATVMRTRNSYLSVIGVVSPMIGLLGTVIGMMKAFSVMGQSGLADPRGLAVSIGEVLMATASGLFIAIPAFIFYYIFRNRAQMVIVHADDQINRLLADIPYEELAGIRIGEQFSAGAGAPTVSTDTVEVYRVSMALTRNCPECNAPVEPGVNPCPNCGAALEWTR
jgi:biopolymer transport protein ExbB